MNIEEKLFAGIEELALKFDELKKSLGKRSDEDALKNIISKLDVIDEEVKQIKQAGQLPNGSIDDVKFQVKELKKIMLEERPETVHRYVELKKGHWWIVGVASYFTVSLLLCFLLVNSNNSLKQEVNALKPNDYKYRYLKVGSFELIKTKKNVVNTTDFLYWIDNQYNSDEQKIQEYVVGREESIRKAFEAAEIAKQKEAEAKVAREEAEKLKSRNNGN